MGVVLALARSSASCTAPGATPRPAQQVHQAVWLALALVAAGQHAAAVPGAVPGAGAGQARGRRQGARLPAGAGLLAAGVAAVHRLPRLQHRGVAAEGGDGAAARRAGAEGAAVGGAGVRRCRRSACRRWACWAAASPPRSRCGCSCWRRSWLLRRDPFYAPFALRGRGLRRAATGPHCAAQLRLGVPMGASILIEVTGFSLHGVLHLAPGRDAGGRPPDRGQPGVAAVHDAAGPRQRHRHAGGAAHRRRRPADARRLGWHGAGSRLRGGAGDGRRGVPGARAGAGRCTPATRRWSPRRCRCWPGWRCSTSPTRRRPWPRSCCAPTRIATVPLVIYALALWGVGLGGGYAAGLRPAGGVPAALQRRAGLLVRGDRWAWSSPRGADRLPGLGAAAAAGRGAGSSLAPARRRLRPSAAPAARSTKQLPPPCARLAAHAAAVALRRSGAPGDRPRPTPPSRSAWPGRRKKGSKMRSR